jgi:hypothetical protein
VQLPERLVDELPSILTKLSTKQCAGKRALPGSSGCQAAATERTRSLGGGGQNVKVNLESVTRAQKATLTRCGSIYRQLRADPGSC